MKSLSKCAISTVVLGIVNGAWATLSTLGRWDISPSTTITLNTDATNGSDTATDCLGTGTGACKTVEGALGLAYTHFDLHGDTAPSKVKVLMGTNDSQGVHQAFHAFAGANGGAAVMIDGGGFTMSAAAQFYFGTVIQIRNITFTSSANCLEVLWGAKVYLLDGITFGACTGAQINIDSGAGHLEVINNYIISGSAAYHIIMASGASLYATNGTTVSFSGAVTFTYFILVASPAYANMQSLIYNLNGHTVTGQKGLIELNGVVLQSTSTLAVSGAVSGTGSVCRLTLASTASLAESQRVNVASVGGTTGCTTTSPTAVPIHIVDGTHIELTGTTFAGVYTSGGTVNIGLPGTVNPSISLGGQFL